MIISRHFSTRELACHDNCGFLPSQEFVNLLDRIRDEFGHPISVTNVARCSVHNRKIGGARNSAHVSGIAADLVYSPELYDFIVKNLDKFNIWTEDRGSTPSWIHIDTKFRPVGRIFKP